MARKKTEGPSVKEQQKIFICLLQVTYNVVPVVDEKQGLTMNRRFVDTYGCFYSRETLVDDDLIGKRWKALGKTWNFDYSNPYVQQWMGV